MLRLIITDDHAIVRHGIKQILNEGLENAEIAEAQNADEAMHLVRQGGWNLIVLDISMPGRSGLEVIQEIRNCTLPPRILVLSMHPEDQLAHRVLKAGVDGYLTKDSAPEELITAVRKILGGGKYISPAFAEKMVSKLQSGAGEQPHDTLSNREYEVMCLIASGKTVSQIAEMLSLSVKTISTYRTRILEKMGMQTNAELTHHAVRHQLVE
jgi:DNA-binding NarL/FixJ family response regulator